MTGSKYPSLYEINTRVWLNHLSRKYSQRIDLGSVPDVEIDELAQFGFDWIWILSVWTTGERSRNVSLSNTEWRREFQHTLPDVTDDDVIGSGFAVADYSVASSLGGEVGLQAFRERLQQRGMKLMLDFVPNHVGLDHHWVNEHPEYFVHGDRDDLVRAPENYIKIANSSNELILAYGRDPYFAGWPDTLQLDYSNPALQAAMTNELLRISAQCDGVRCDMAMLVLPEIFERTWGKKAQPFWPAAIPAVRQLYPNFVFLAEVYWEMEWLLQQQGFSYTYDKRLYDRLRSDDPKSIREHLIADLGFQGKLARFLENHDEPRAAATFDKPRHLASALITFLSPGMRFFHQGQFEGFRSKISPHLGRGPMELVDATIRDFYEKLLRLLRLPLLRDGEWKLLYAGPAWDMNWTHESIVTFEWTREKQKLLVVVNFSNHNSQGYIRMETPSLFGRRWKLADAFCELNYVREGYRLMSPGLYVDMQPWQVYCFDISEFVDS